MTTTDTNKGRFSLLLGAGLWLLCSILYMNTAHAHGSSEPMHGGQVVIVGDMSFELVHGNNQVELFLIDDGNAMDTADLKAKLKLKDESPARFIELTPAGGNRFIAKGISLKPGAKVLALVTMANGYSKIGANFVIGK